jgi:DHA1 family tetracycline resistance protein-like MFS transporter
MSMWMITDFAFLLPDTYYSLYVEALGASAFTLGAAVAASGFSMAFLQLAGGYWADKHGRKKLIVSMNFARALAFLVFALAPNWYFILLGEILVGMTAINQPAVMAIFADSLPPENRGLGYSLSTFAGVTSVLSPLVAGLLYLSYKLIWAMRIAYLLVCACWLVSGIILSRLKETLQPETSRISIRQAVGQYPTAVKECVTVWRLVPKSMVNLFLVFTPTVFVVRMCIPFYILYATQVLRVDAFQWALLQVLGSVVLYLVLLPTGRLVDLFGRKTPLLLSSVFFAVGITLFMAGNLLMLYIFVALSSVGNALVFIAYPALQADLTPQEYRGRVMGFSNFTDSFLGAAAVLLGGLLYEKVAPVTPFVTQLIILIIAIPSTYLFIEEGKTRTKATETRTTDQVKSAEIDQDSLDEQKGKMPYS